MERNVVTRVPRILAVAAAALLIAASGGNEAGSDEAWSGQDQKCQECHDETSELPALGIFQTVHAFQGDERTPFGSGQGCAACHGDGAAHMRATAPGEKRAPMGILFAAGAPAGPKNAACLACHQGGTRLHWQGGAHETAGNACSDCHRVHAAKDPMLVKDRTPGTWRRGQADVAMSRAVSLAKAPVGVKPVQPGART